MVDAPRSEERKINTTQTAIRNLFLQRREASCNGSIKFPSLFYSFIMHVILMFHRATLEFHQKYLEKENKVDIWQEQGSFLML